MFREEDPQQVLILVGLPGCGKSTRAKSLVDAFPLLWHRINKDDLRAMLSNSFWSGKSEVQIVAARNAILDIYLNAGKNVVIDDTNIEGNHIQSITDMVAKTHPEYKVTYQVMDVPLEECLRRNDLRTGTAKVPVASVMRMNKTLRRKISAGELYVEGK